MGACVFFFPADTYEAVPRMGNKCMRPAVALDDAPPSVEAPALFEWRYPEKYRCVCDLEDALHLLASASHNNQAASPPMVWDDYDRSAINCLRNCIMHLKTSVVEGRKRRVRGRKQVSVSAVEEVVERWGDAGTLLFASEEPPTPPSYEEDTPAFALAPSSAPVSIEAKARQSGSWEGDARANYLSRASTPVSSLTKRLRSR
ncbi:hypothetical protein T484DRAFT_1745257 [Baffinella frigidus]|nr:hypothetical protein T484DRAFT_1745257 [Cryptophyta sp. CCMP2293]